MIDSFVGPMLMAIEILAADFIFGMLLNRRKPFWFRPLVCLIVILEVIMVITLLYFKVTGKFLSYGSTDSYTDSVYKFVFYLFIFIMTLFGMLFCYDNSAWTILFYGSGGYAAQHICKNIASLGTLVPVLSEKILQMPWISYLLEIGVCSAVYVVLFFLFVWRKRLAERTKGIKKKVFISLFVIIVCIGLSRISTDDASRGTMAFVAETLYAVISCMLILFILSNLTENDEMHREVDMMGEILHREKEQYDLVKENIELINIKCHDIKHQIRELWPTASDAPIRQLEDSVKIYDSVQHTGNDVLDVILTEKSLYCEKNHIRLECVVKGEMLSFMSNMDLYSLFGNAISNAIESVRKIKSEEKRFISLNVYPSGKFLSMHIENYYEGEILFENGFPVTSKDKLYHGLGVKSMDYIAKKYNGYMSISAKNGKFRLDFLFPLTPETQKK